jgi:signal transduction histidine kinase
MDREVLIGVAGLRWAAWIVLAVVALVNLHRVHHPVLAVAAIAGAGAMTVAAFAALRRDGWRRALSPCVVGAEIAVAVAVVVADGWVHQGRVAGQTLAGTWPLAGILVAAVAGGLVWGVAAGALLGGARFVSVLVAGWGPGQGGRSVVAALSTAITWIVVGAVCATIMWLLRRAQRQLVAAEAREDVARHLHDGVLQTLALIERRSESPTIARLARDQERELRAYLFGDHREPGGLAAELRAAAGRLEQAWPDTAVTVTVSDDIPALDPDRVRAVVGAASEALTNAAKHGGAQHVVVFADLDDSSGGLFLSVKDDGTGFDPASVAGGVGMTGSIRARVERVGGRVEFSSLPGQGSEVRIGLPASDPTPRTSP